LDCPVLTALLEDALRETLAPRKPSQRRSKLRLSTFGRGGVQPHVDLDDVTSRLLRLPEVDRLRPPPYRTGTQGVSFVQCLARRIPSLGRFPRVGQNCSWRQNARIFMAAPELGGEGRKAEAKHCIIHNSQSESAWISDQGRKGGALAPPLQGPHNHPHVSRPAQSVGRRTVRAARGKGGRSHSSGGAKAPPFHSLE
jgi:hypothetical protein